MTFSVQCRSTVECFERVFTCGKIAVPANLIAVIIEDVIKKHYSRKQSAKLTQNFMHECTTLLNKKFSIDLELFPKCYWTPRYVLRAAFALIEYKHMVVMNVGATFSRDNFKDKYYGNKYFSHVTEEELQLLVLFREFAAAALRTMVNPKRKQAMIMFIASSFSEGKTRTYITGGNPSKEVSRRKVICEIEGKTEVARRKETNASSDMLSATYEDDKLLIHGNQTPALPSLTCLSPPLLSSTPEHPVPTPFSQLPTPPSSHPSPTLPVFSLFEFENTAELGDCDPLSHRPIPVPSTVSHTMKVLKRKHKDCAVKASCHAKKVKPSSPSKSTRLLSSLSLSPPSSSHPMPSHKSASTCPPSVAADATEPPGTVVPTATFSLLPISAQRAVPLFGVLNPMDVMNNSDPFSPELFGDSLDCPVEDNDLYSHTLHLLTFPRVCALAYDTEDMEGTDDEDCSMVSQFDRLAGRVCAGPGCQWVDLALSEHTSW